MKLERVELFSYSLRYRQKVMWSDIQEDSADYVLLKLTDTEGRVGLGEATVKPSWSGHSVGTMLCTLRELVLPHLRRGCLAEDGRPLGRLVAEQPQACGLAESAWRMLAAAPRGAQPALEVPVSCTLTRQPPLDMAQQAAQRHADYGVRHFKLKGGQGAETDAQGVREVLRAVANAQVQVDANSAYPAHALQDYSSRLQDAGAFFLEDPCPLALGDFPSLARASRLPLLVDWAVRNADTAAFFAAGGASAISVKPGRYGAGEAVAVAAAARTRGARVGLGLFGESDLGAALNLQLQGQGTLGADPLPAELTFHLALQDGLLDRSFEPVAGRLRVPAAADIAARVDWSRMNAHAC